MLPPPLGILMMLSDSAGLKGRASRTGGAGFGP
jgi:hypothetical protein